MEKELQNLKIKMKEANQELLELIDNIDNQDDVENVRAKYDKIELRLRALDREFSYLRRMKEVADFEETL